MTCFVSHIPISNLKCLRRERNGEKVCVGGNILSVRDNQEHGDDEDNLEKYHVFDIDLRRFQTVLII